MPPQPPLRVLHFGRFHDPRNFGGIVRHVQTLLAGLAPHLDADNLVAADSLSGEHFTCDGYRVHRAPSFGVRAGIALAPTLPLWARRLERAHAYDIVHLHFPDPLSHWAVQRLPRRIKRVITWHSDIVRQRRLLTLYRPWLRRFLADADAVIVATPHHFTSSTQLDSVSAEHRHVIPYGLDYRFLDEPVIQILARDFRSSVPGGPLVFAMGRHVYYKGFDILIRALQSLPGVTLALGGHGPLTATLQDLATASGVADRVRFLGRLSETDLAAWYHACDVFCLPSTAVSEAFGLVQLEAMACGKPVVCSRLNNGVNYVNPEGVTGLAATPGDPGDLARTLKTLIDNTDLRHALGEQARLRARLEYSQNTMVTRTLDLYHRLREG